MSRMTNEKKIQLKDLSVKKVVKCGIAWGGPTMLKCRKAGGEQQELVASARDANLFS